MNRKNVSSVKNVPPRLYKILSFLTLVILAEAQFTLSQL